MMGQNNSQRVTGIVLCVLAILLVVGVNTFAGPCGVHDDGSVSTCFWAARAVTGVGVVAAVLALVRMLVRDDGVRRGLSVSLVGLGVLAALVPGTLIDLCMMQTMRCHAIMRPFVLAVGVLIALVGVADVVMRPRSSNR